MKRYLSVVLLLLFLPGCFLFEEKEDPYIKRKDQGKNFDDDVERYILESLSSEEDEGDE